MIGGERKDSCGKAQGSDGAAQSARAIDQPFAPSAHLFPVQRHLYFVVLLATLFTFILIQVGLLRKTGYWLDEFFTMWVSDPSVPLAEILLDRTLPNTNPPGYGLAIYGFRQYFSIATALIAINAIALGVSIFTVLTSAKRAGMSGIGCLAACFFLMSGPVLYYFGEARAYVCALALTFATSWIISQWVVFRNGAGSVSVCAGLGILAALIHPYASLYCCSLAAAVLCVALSEPDRFDLTRRGLALGMGAALTTALIMAPIEDAVAKTDWIIFDWEHVSKAAIKAAALSLAPAWVAIWIGLMWAAYSRIHNLRVLSLLFAVTYLCFVILPILISFKAPIITGRYWMIGSPGLIVFAAFALRERLSERWSANAGRALVASGSIILILSVALARYAYNARPNWSGSDVVKPLFANCENPSVRIANSFKSTPVGIVADGGFVPGFSYLSGRPEENFVQVKGSETARLQIAPSQCRLIGWAENVDAAYMKSASERDLMNLLNIDGDLNQVRIDRHMSGYFVLRKSGLSQQ